MQILPGGRYSCLFSKYYWCAETQSGNILAVEVMFCKSISPEIIGQKTDISACENKKT